LLQRALACLVCEEVFGLCHHEIKLLGFLVFLLPAQLDLTVAMIFEFDIRIKSIVYSVEKNIVLFGCKDGISRAIRHFVIVANYGELDGYFRELELGHNPEAVKFIFAQQHTYTLHTCKQEK
jgi:hypothetical protein